MTPGLYWRACLSSPCRYRGCCRAAEFRTNNERCERHKPALSAAWRGTGALCRLAAVQQAGDDFLIFSGGGGLKKALAGEIRIARIKPFVLELPGAELLAYHIPCKFE